MLTLSNGDQVLSIADQNIRDLPEEVTLSGLIAELRRRLRELGDVPVGVHRAGEPDADWYVKEWRHPYGWFPRSPIQTQAHSGRVWIVS